MNEAPGLNLDNHCFKLAKPGSHGGLISLPQEPRHIAEVCRKYEEAEDYIPLWEWYDQLMPVVNIPERIAVFVRTSSFSGGYFRGSVCVHP